MKILFLTHLLPYPPDVGGYIRTYHLIRSLSRKNDVDLVTYLYHPDDRRHVTELARLCHSIDVLPLKRKMIFPYLLLSFLDRRPFWYLRDHSQAMAELIRKKLDSRQYDMIFQEQFQMAGYIPNHFNQGYRIYANIMIGEMILDRYRVTQKNPLVKAIAWLETKKIRAFEKKVCENADLTLTITDEDKAVLNRYGIPNNKLRTIPMGVDTSRFRPLDLNFNSKNIILLGLARLPFNVEGILYFYNVCRFQVLYYS